ncbi:MAG: adenine deaminase [Gemmatimonadota bacterium]|jgi:adenine deaminase
MTPGLKDTIRAARGDIAADLLLRNARLVNVFSGEIHAADIAIRDGVVVGLGPGRQAREVVDLGGRYVAPGLIDAHVHVESAMVPPSEFARAVVTRGVTTVVTDPHEIANVHGLEGIRFMLEDARGAPFTMFVNAPSCVPATHLETSGAALTADDLVTLLDHEGVLGLAEVMNFPGVIAGDDAVLAKLRAFDGRPIDGHCPGLGGTGLEAYVAAGIRSDHECTTVAEAHEKLRLGLTVFMREATNARNLRALLPLVTAETERRICFATDDRVPADLLGDGSIDHMLRVAIHEGIPPVAAIRMATLNPAEYFCLRDRGAVAPGKRADLFVFRDLGAPRAESVYVAGRLVARDGAMTVERMHERVAAPANPVQIDRDRLDLTIEAVGARVQVIGAVPDQIVTERRVMDATVRDGLAVADPGRDLLKMAVIERHGRNGGVGLGFVTGVGLHHGAIAGTVAHDHHNLVVIGADDRSMLTAVRAVATAGGGLAVADGEVTMGVLPLPIAGLMSDRPIEEVRDRMAELITVARQLGSPLHDPFMAMSFLALEVIPALKLTDRGLVDVDRFDFVPLFTG